MNEIKKALSIPAEAWLIIFLNAILGIAQFIVTPYLAIFLHSYRYLTPMEDGLILGISPLIATILAPINGVLIKKWGYRNSLVIGSLGWITASIIYANATVFPLFICATLITGLTGGIENIAFTTILSLSAPDDKQDSVFNINYWILNVTACLGPLIGTWMGSGKNPNLFYLVTVGEIISTTLIVFTTKKMHSLDRQKGYSTKLSKQFLPLAGILRESGFIFLIFGAFIFLVGNSQIDSNFSLFLSSAYSNGVKLYGRLQFLDGLAALILQPAMFWITKKIGLKKAVWLGPLICSGAFLMFNIHSEPLAYLAMIVFTTGTVLYNPNVTAMVSKFSKHDQRSEVFGAFNLYGIGSFVGPTMGAWILTNCRSLFMIFVALTFLLSSLVMFFYGQRIFRD